MRLLVAVSLVVAVTALVFALWPVVADAPWEEELVVPTPVVREPRLTECEQLSVALTEARTDTAAQRIWYTRHGC